MAHQDAFPCNCATLALEFAVTPARPGSTLGPEPLTVALSRLHIVSAAFAPSVHYDERLCMAKTLGPGMLARTVYGANSDEDRL